MQKDPNRTNQSFETEGNVNEFEFQKNQQAMAEQSELPSTDENDEPKQTRAEHVAEVTAEAHRKVENRK